MPRFNMDSEPNEPFRFEWVVEIDPYTPGSMPVKRTALGRFGHEAATTVINGDGRVVVYMGDDDYFEYAYKFVSNGTFNPTDREANFGLLDDGTLYVARFNEDGTVDWLPLVQGEGPLTAANGFATQADVLINPRGAGDVLGATPMDRPEDFEANPVTGGVYLVLTKNKKREAGAENAANNRAVNLTGHILELVPPIAGGTVDHAAERYEWDAFILAGDPQNPEHGALYGEGVSTTGWFACPDNVAFDPSGRLWVATDGAPAFEISDGLYGVDTDGPGRAVPRQLYCVPSDAEVCGPCFTPDGTTLFIAVQHPGEESDNLETVSTRWPDFDPAMPPRPSVVVITRDGGGVIGS
jgi:secreted PhoX family phosphatase